MILHLTCRQISLSNAVLINVLEEIVIPVVLDQFDGGFEGDKFTQFRHIDSVAIRITDLRRSGGDHDLSWLGAA